MSVISKQGDHGDTRLLYGRAIRKSEARVTANGAVDELNAVLGLVRAHLRGANPALIAIESEVAVIQDQLITLMGQVATLPEDRHRYRDDGYPSLAAPEVEALTMQAQEVEKKLEERFRDWAVPGHTGSLPAAHLDHARTVCRRAESALWVVQDADEGLEPCAVYLNRLGDLLWLWARAVERQGGSDVQAES